MKTKMFHVKHYPPGMNIEGEKLFFGLGMVVSFLYSTVFLGRYVQELSRLYAYSEGTLVIGIFIENFWELLGNALVGFEVMAISMLAFAILHYSYFWQGSKSIYLMKRLPDGKELYKRVFAMPLIGFVICVGAGVLLLGIYYGVYIIVTPKVWIAPEQWLFG